MPASNSRSTRSRAVSLPASCWRRRRSSPPPSSASRSSSARRSVGVAHRTDPCAAWAFSQSFRNFSRPMSVSGCLKHASITAAGHVQTSRAHARGLDDVHRMAHAGDEHLGREVVVARRSRRSAGSRPMPSVAMSSSRPTNGLTYAAPTLAANSACVGEKISVTLTRMPSPDERLGGLDALARERHLHDDVLVDRRELAALGDHAGRVGRDDLGAHRPLHELADLLDDRARVAALLRQQRRIRRDAVDDAERHQRLDVLAGCRSR